MILFFNSHKHYFPQALLEECQQKIQEKEIKSSIVNNLEGSSDEDYSSSDDDDDDDDDNDDDDNSDERDNVYPLFVDGGHDPVDGSSCRFR